MVYKAHRSARSTRGSAFANRQHAETTGQHTSTPSFTTTSSRRAVQNVSLLHTASGI